MEIVQFNIDTKSIESAIKKTTLNFDKMLVKMQLSVNKEVIKSAKKRFKALFDVKNHNKYTLSGTEKPILSNFKTVKGKEARTSWILNKAFYARFLEQGAKITAAKSKWLTFKAGGQWHKVKSVTIPARPFLKPAVEEFWNSEKSVKIAEAVLQKELEKYWDK